MDKPLILPAWHRSRAANNSAGDRWHMHQRRLSKSDPVLVLKPERGMQCQETQFPGIPVGVAAPQPPRAPAGDCVGLTWSSPRLTSCAALAARGRCAAAGLPPPLGGLGLPRCSCSALSSSSNSLPRGRGPTARGERRTGRSSRIFFHTGRAARRAASEQRVEEAKKMPLSLPPQGDPGESSPSRTSKKHTSFHIWRSKKKQQPPPSDCGVFVPHPLSDCGVFVPHPPPTPLGEAR